MLSEAEELELLLLAEAESSEQPMLQQAPAVSQQPSVMQQLGQTALQQGPMVALGQATQMGFEKAGENIAQNLASGISYKPNPIMQAIGGPAALMGSVQPTPGQGFKTNPEVAAAVGTGVQMIPDIATSLIPMGPAAQGIKAGTKAVSKMVGTGERLAGLSDQLLAQQGALSEVGIKAGAREAALLAEKQAVGKAIGQAEELGGFAMKETPEHFTQIMKDPAALNDFSNFMRKVSEKPIDELVKTADKPALQTLRKFAQTFREMGPQVSNTVKANIAQGGHAAKEALMKADETFGTVIKEWEKVSNKIDRIPTDIKKQKAAIQGAMRATRQAIKETRKIASRNQTIKKVILTTAGVGTLGKWLLGS